MCRAEEDNEKVTITIMTFNYDEWSERHSEWDFGATLGAEDLSVEQADLVNYLVNHHSLSRMETLLMKLRYLEEYTFSEIGKVCGVTESRISQVHSNLMKRFRAMDYSKVL